MPTPASSDEVDLSAVNRRVAGWGAPGYSDGERPNGTPTTAFPKYLRQTFGPTSVQFERVVAPHVSA